MCACVCLCVCVSERKRVYERMCVSGNVRFVEFGKGTKNIIELLGLCVSQ